MLHKDHVLHRDAACTRQEEVPNILRENWKAYTQRVKPILKIIQTEREKEIEQGTFLKGIEKLMASNTENMKSFFPQCEEKRTFSLRQFFPLNKTCKTY